MDSFYRINPFNRKTSLAVLPVDCFTGMAVANKKLEIAVPALNVSPVIKSDGYYAFFNMPKGTWEVRIKSEEFFEQSFKAEISDSLLTVSIKLIPCGAYKIPTNTTFIDCGYYKDSQVHIIPLGGAPCGKLKSLNNDSISIRVKAPKNLTGQLLGFYNNGKAELFEVGDVLEKNTYFHNFMFENTYKPGADIYWVTTGKSDREGRLFCPIKGFSDEHKEIVIINERDGAEYYETHEITYGKGNAIQTNSM